jgi:hypothetical protein
MRDNTRKREYFPRLGGIFVAVPGVAALFTDVSQPFWVIVKVLLIVATFGFAVASLVGVAVVRYRRSSAAEDGSP